MPIAPEHLSAGMRAWDAYVERLPVVSSDGAWTAWCRFLLDGVAEQAADNERKMRAILALYERTKDVIVDLTRSQHGVRALDCLFREPVFGSARFVAQSGITKPTALRLIAALREAGLVTTVRAPRGRRAGVYAFGPPIAIAEGRSSA